MSLTIDYVTMAPKSQEVSQQQTGELARMQSGAEELAVQYQNNVQKQSERTVRKEKAENRELKNEDRERQQRGRKKKNQSDRDSGDEKDAKEPHFDMRV
ncbi:MAG: hypothetical protein LUH14_05030 [Clostridiaceae bacterium]|nr:hypothetical protein [Clostridiaceae bacterium]